MKKYYEYVEHLRGLNQRTRGAARVTLKDQAAVESALNGGAGSALRRLVALEELRAHGAFFTGSQLAEKVAARIQTSLGNRSVVVDPACGAGDLLLACATQLLQVAKWSPVSHRWDTRLIGRDLVPAFVDAAKLRLSILAASHGMAPPTSKRSWFPQVAVGCGMADTQAIQKATHVVLNPPFVLVPAPDDCGWASGQVNAAGIFLDKIVAEAASGAQVIAILPDVLRSGSRYQAWRKAIERRCTIEYVSLEGQFDALTDVDVFVLHLTVRAKGRVGLRQSANKWKLPGRARKSVQDVFDVSVGPVVDFRDPHKGQWRKFICTQTLAPWARLSSVDSHRRFSGRLIKSPFVAVRRTSRPGDKYRASATLVTLPVPAAVENHVMVLQPLDGKLKTCKQLMKVLKRPSATRNLDARIRCRHLTVGALKDLPWSDE